MPDDAAAGAPPGFAAEYAREVTDLSYQELRVLALEAKAMGPEFYVIGGWAAWRHHQTLGSRDIDVIFPDVRLMDAFLRRYYDKRGFVNVGGFLAKKMRKRVTVAGRVPVDPGRRGQVASQRGGEVEIEIDAAGIDQGPPFKEDPRRNLPFRLLEKHHETWDLDGPRTRIPTKELLILQKIKAHRDRTHDLAREVDPLQSAWLRSKIWKDEHDIRGLAKTGLDWADARAIAQDNDCADLVDDTMQRLRLKGR